MATRRYSNRGEDPTKSRENNKILTRFIKYDNKRSGNLTSHNNVRQLQIVTIRENENLNYHNNVRQLHIVTIREN